MQQPAESNTFMFGPGEWRLQYHPSLYDFDQQNIQFSLKYLGKAAAAECNTTDDDGKEPPIFIKLALLSRNGLELESMSRYLFEFRKIGI